MWAICECSTARSRPRPPGFRHAATSCPRSARRQTRRYRQRQRDAAMGAFGYCLCSGSGKGGDELCVLSPRSLRACST
jgi:hypothetical protein